MFLAIQLLSSPVAAKGSCEPGSVFTDVNISPTAPTVTITVAPGTINVDDDDDHAIDFLCDVEFNDNTGQASGSNHIATMTVWETSGTPWTFIGSDTTGTQYLDPNTQCYEDTLSVTDNYGSTPPLPTYTVFISASCTDLTPPTSTTTPTPGAASVVVI